MSTKAHAGTAPDGIRSKRWAIEREYRRAMDQAKKDREIAERALQAECTHPNTRYHPDPSGNNGSYYECDDCGKEI